MQTIEIQRNLSASLMAGHIKKKLKTSPRPWNPSTDIHPELPRYSDIGINDANGRPVIFCQDMAQARDISGWVNETYQN